MIDICIRHTQGFIMMHKHIITRNNYLKIALCEIMDKHYTCSDYIMIDLDCSSELKEISFYASLCKYFRWKLFFIGGKGIYSELFSSFNIIDLNESVNSVTNKLSYNGTINPDEVRKYIKSVRKLEKLTQDQIKLCLLDLMQDLRIAPRVMSLNTSSVYRNIWIAAKKLNFSSRLHFRTFIKNEYSIEQLKCLL